MTFSLNKYLTTEQPVGQVENPDRRPANRGTKRTPAAFLVLASRLGLLLTLLGVLAAAFVPLGLAPSIGGSDWISHGMAFAVLAVLFALALPGRSLVVLWLGLAIVGAGIEILQATPLVGRGPSVAEALWDALVAAVVLVLMKFGGLRARLTGACS